MVPDAVTAALLVLAPCLPLALALSLAVKAWRSWVPAMAPWTALPVTVAPLLLDSGTVLDLPWLMLGGRLGLDLVSAPLMLGTGILWFVAAWYAWCRPEPAGLGPGFWFSFLAGLSGFAGVLVAQDMLGFFLFYALMGFAAYGLVIHAGDAAAKRAARVYIILLVIGETMLFAALLLAASPSGDLQFTAEAGSSPPGLMTALVVFGFGIKAGILPVHVSLPLIYTAAPTPGAVVLAGAMINAGLVGWLRFLPMDGSGSPEWGTLMLAAGLAAAFYGALVGLTQSNPRTLLAYSSISQMGLMTIGVGAGLLVPEAWPAILPAVLLYAVHHALAKGALFFGLGLVAKSGQAASAGGLLRLSLWLPALALAGLPLTSGALAKSALKSSATLLPETWSGVLAVLLPLAAVGTTLLVLRFMALIPPASKSRISGSIYLAWGLLVAAGLVIPWIWFGHLPAASAAVSPSGLWRGIWPVAAGAILAWSAVAVFRRRSPARRLAIPAGDVLLVAESLTTGLVRQLRSGGAVQVGRSATTRRWPKGALLGETLGRLEDRQRRWHVAGTAFLTVYALVLLLSLL